jgi:TolB-like protein
MAVLAADVAGYSRLVGADEEGSLVQWKAHWHGLIDPKIKEHQGRVVRITGDGLLVEFASVIAAVRCAVEVQRAMGASNAEVSQEKRIEFRMGINVGDMIIDGTDMWGEGVNVAARLEALAEPGGICVSGRVQEDVRGKIDVAFEDMGERQLKNIAQPVRVYRVRLDGAVVRPAPALPDKPSIAVLPFNNMSGDPEQEYFADGMVEEIITALSRTRWLFVIARNSSFIYKGRAVDVKQVGHELGVRYVLEGGVRKAANRVRITAQLIDVSTGAHLWADRFDGSLGYFRPAGPGDRERCGRNRAQARAGRDRARQAQADREPRRLRLFSAWHGQHSSDDQGNLQRGATAIQQGYRARPFIRLSSWRGGVLLFVG